MPVGARQMSEMSDAARYEAIKSGDVTDEEFSNAKLSIINSYRELTDSARALEIWYLGRLLSGVVSDPNEVVKGLEGVSLGDAVAAANKATLDTVYFLNGTLKGGNTNA